MKEQIQEEGGGGYSGLEGEIGLIQLDQSGANNFVVGDLGNVVRKPLVPFARLSTVEWMIILSFGIFKNDMRECLNLFVSNSYMYKITHDFDWFWKHSIYLLLGEFQFRSKKLENSKQDFTNFGSFIKEVQNCNLLYRRGTHSKHTKHLKKDDNPKMLFLQVWKRVVVTGGSDFAPYISDSKRMNWYILNIDDAQSRFAKVKVTRNPTDTHHLFSNYEGAVKSLEISREKCADNEIRLKAFEMAMRHVFKICNFFTQSACNGLLIELDMMLGLFSKTDIPFRSRLIPLKCLIEKRESFTPIIELACRFYKLTVFKQLKNSDFHQVFLNDISEILVLLQSFRMHNIDDEHTIGAFIFSCITMDPICPARHPNTNIIDHLRDNIEFKLEVSNIRSLFDSLDKMNDLVLSRNKTISITQEESCKAKFGLISLITNMDEKKTLFDTIINEHVVYQVTELDISKFLSLHSDRVEDVKKLMDLVLKQNKYGLEQINTLFDTKLDFNSHSKLINYLLEFEQYQSMISISNSLMHSLCKQFYTFLKELDSIHTTPLESNEPFETLFENFKNLFDLLHSKGFVNNCTDQRVLTEMLSNRLQSFLTDNPNNNIPNTIIGRIHFLHIKFSATALLDFNRLVELNHFTPLHILYYSSLSLSSEVANTTWTRAFSHVHSKLTANGEIPKILEFSLLEKTSEFTLSNFTQELLDLIVLIQFNPCNLTSQ